MAAIGLPYFLKPFRVDVREPDRGLRAKKKIAER